MQKTSGSHTDAIYKALLCRRLGCNCRLACWWVWFGDWSRRQLLSMGTGAWSESSLIAKDIQSSMGAAPVIRCAVAVHLQAAASMWEGQGHLS